MTGRDEDRILYTIGHSNREMAEFLKLLESQSIWMDNDVISERCLALEQAIATALGRTPVSPRTGAVPIAVEAEPRTSAPEPQEQVKA